MPKRGEHLTEEQLIAVERGDAYRRLNRLARLITLGQTRGREPSPAQVAEVAELKARIAALKSGQRYPTEGAS
jgi:hypothetical protein